MMISTTPSKILCIAVHPDDETLGCGGTLLKEQGLGNSINCLFITDGNSCQRKAVPELDKLYNFDNIYRLDLIDAKLDEMSLGVLISKISCVFHELEPETLFIPNRCDAHSDHRVVYQAVAACTKVFRYPFIKQILMMEVISETDTIPALPETAFIPNVFSDISSEMGRKMDILKTFESELMDYPKIRSEETIRAHARYRGGQIDKEYAEAFMLLRSIR